MSIQSNFPAIRPSLLLDFANVKALDPRVTFTRASTATFYDGKTVAKAEENLLLVSEQFDNAGWSKSELTVSANSVVAPDGNTTADTITPSTNSARHTIQQSFTSAGATYVYSVYAKPNGYNRITIREAQSSGNGATFDVSTGTVVTNIVSGVGSIVSVGNGWYRCSMVATETSGTRAMQILVNTNAGSGFEAAFVGDGTSGVYIWGAQLEQRSAVTAYTPTTTQAITNYIPALQTAASGVARFDHNPTTGESLGLLIEEQRTNLLTNSAFNLSVSQAGSNSTIPTISPDGTLSAGEIIPDTTTTLHQWNFSASYTSGIAYTYSFFAKLNPVTASTTTLVALNGTSASTIGSVGSFFVNLSTGATSGAASATAVGNGWYRVAITFTPTATSSSNFFIRAVNASNASAAGNGFSGIYIWGAQLEAGAFATSYIPTVASQVTRSADAASMTGTNFSSWYRANEGTTYAEGMQTTISIADPVIVAINNGTVNNGFELYQEDLGQGRVYFSLNGAANYTGQVSGVFTSNNNGKLVLAYAANDLQLCGNAVLATAGTVATVPIVDRLAIGGRTAGTRSWNGTIKKLAYYPARLTNTQLQALTS